MHPHVPAIALVVVAAVATLDGQQQRATSPPVNTRSVDPHRLPGTNGRAFSTIGGNALDNAGAGMPNVTVRLRDARNGRVVESQVTDAHGQFAFRSVDRGSYIVEIVGANEAVLAASQLLNVNAGDALTAVVKLPFRIPPFAGVLGHTTQSGVVVAALAASAEVLAVTATKCASPPCGN
jgi:hypothetical protein